MNWTIQPAERLRGTVRVPGDKSISHRAVLLATIAEGDSDIDGLSNGEDVRATLSAAGALGVAHEINETTGALRARIAGRGLDGLTAPAETIDCGNSGTTMRLLAGILAGQPFATTLSGDASLRRRPMERIAEPLRAMDCALKMASGGTAPLHIEGKRPLRAITHRPEVASAQVKSCVLLAGLYADAATAVEENALTRDHTERLLTALGAQIEQRDSGGGSFVAVEPGPSLKPLNGRIPGDLSAAAYWLVAASIVPDSELTLPGVGLNPSRRAIVDLLHQWGAEIEVSEGASWCGEPVGVVTVRGTGEPLRGGVIDGDMISGLIDELPLVAALAPLTADGVEIRGAGELRVKESDRIATSAQALRNLGVRVEEFPDGLAVTGGQVLGGGTVDAAGDHRIALAMGAVALAASGPVTIAGAEAIRVSYPGFDAALAGVAA